MQNVNVWLHSLTQHISKMNVAAYVAFRILWLLPSIFGNSLTILSIFKFEYQWTPTNLILANMAFGDASNIWEFMISQIHQFRKDILISVNILKPFCLIEEIMDMVLTLNNIVSVFLVAVDRFISVIYPLRYSLIVQYS